MVINLSFDVEAKCVHCSAFMHVLFFLSNILCANPTQVKAVPMLVQQILLSTYFRS